MLSEKEIDMLLEGDVREVYYVAHMNEVVNPFMDFTHYITKPTYVVVKLYVDRIVNAYNEYMALQKLPGSYEYNTETVWYGDGSKHNIKYYANKDSITNAIIPVGIFDSEHTVYSMDNKDDKTISNLKSSIQVLYTNDRTILNDRKYYRLPEVMDMGAYKFEYAYSDYYILQGHSTSVVKNLLIKVGDINQVFINLDDALAHANQLEA